MADHGHFHWNELMTRDAEKAKAFYTACVGWTFEPMSMGEGEGQGEPYWIAMIDDEPAAGIFKMEGAQFEGVPEAWMSYLHVDDVDAAVEKAVANGATVMREAFDAPGVGRIVILQEPGGAVIGWMTAVDFDDEDEDEDEDDSDESDDDESDDDEDDGDDEAPADNKGDEKAYGRHD